MCLLPADERASGTNQVRWAQAGTSPTHSIVPTCMLPKSEPCLHLECSWFREGLGFGFGWGGQECEAPAWLQVGASAVPSGWDVLPGVGLVGLFP